MAGIKLGSLPLSQDFVLVDGAEAPLGSFQGSGRGTVGQTTKPEQGQENGLADSGSGFGTGIL